MYKCPLLSNFPFTKKNEKCFSVMRTGSVKLIVTFRKDTLQACTLVDDLRFIISELYKIKISLWAVTVSSNKDYCFFTHGLNSCYSK